MVDPRTAAPAREDLPRYTAAAIALHWLVAVAVVAAVALALTLQRLDLGATKDALLALHKSVGLTILALTVVRLGWRVARPPPPMPASIPAWQRAAAKAVHAALYLVTLAMPISGYVSVAARGRATVLFGLWDVPRWVPLDRALARTAENVHATSQYLLYALVALHVGAGLYHHFVARDRVLARIWPGGAGISRRPPSS
jgi:cytochrome b561